MCFYQIAAQAAMYWWTPIATNIAAIYPTSIPFPVVAVCNNNQFRLTYLTSIAVQNRRARPLPGASNLINSSGLNRTVFEHALETSWDVDAVKFLRSAGHWRTKMILKCQWPNGTACSAADFRPVWTLTGLCWAINTDPLEPHHVIGAGPGNALRLLLNVERYERVEGDCGASAFRTTSLPGAKILIYNQSDVPVSSLDGVNAPAGYTMDVPFRVQHRQKLPGKDCASVVDGGLERQRGDGATSCIIRNHLEEIEGECNCSIRQAFSPKSSGKD